MQPIYEAPWPPSHSEECYWYHTLTFPDGEVVNGSWTIPDFKAYIGGYDIVGKTVLDVGTASGFLAFNAEKLGATVAGLDAASTKEFRHVPFADSPSYMDIAASQKRWEKDVLIPIKKSWWYAWHKFGSKNKCIYAPIPDLYEWDQKFDVVIAGAIIEHLSDPVYFIGALTKVAKEAVLLPWTDFVGTDELLIKPMTDWSNSGFHYAWWMLSLGMYRKLFDQLGFDIDLIPSSAIHNHDPAGKQMSQRNCIIAKRR